MSGTEPKPSPSKPRAHPLGPSPRSGRAQPGSTQADPGQSKGPAKAAGRAAGRAARRAAGRAAVLAAGRAAGRATRRASGSVPTPEMGRPSRGPPPPAGKPSGQEISGLSGTGPKASPTKHHVLQFGFSPGPDRVQLGSNQANPGQRLGLAKVAGRAAGRATGRAAGLATGQAAGRAAGRAAGSVPTPTMGRPARGPPPPAGNSLDKRTRKPKDR